MIEDSSDIEEAGATTGKDRQAKVKSNDLFLFEKEEEEEIQEIEGGDGEESGRKGGDDVTSVSSASFTETCKSLNNLILQYRLLTDSKIQKRLHVRK